MADYCCIAIYIINNANISMMPTSEDPHDPHQSFPAWSTVPGMMDRFDCQSFSICLGGWFFDCGDFFLLFRGGLHLSFSKVMEKCVEVIAILR